MGCNSSTDADASGETRAQLLRRLARREYATDTLSRPGVAVTATQPDERDANPLSAKHQPPAGRKPLGTTRQRLEQRWARTNTSDTTTTSTSTLHDPAALPSATSMTEPPATGASSLLTVAAPAPQRHGRRHRGADMPMPALLVLPDTPMLVSEGAASSSGAAALAGAALWRQP